MAKTKSITAVEFEIGVKGRKPYIVTADAWNLGSEAYQTGLMFFLRGELVFSVARQKWDYVRRVTEVPQPTKP